jgi:nitroimidazol reductase NimA-like FMN-containing flavoprotein (pyridoxamine 5'-phosphate oxidase superfamily)
MIPIQGGGQNVADMTKQEREAFLADVHIGVISIAEEGRGPLTVPIWYAYDPGGDLHIITGRESRKGRLLARAGRFSLCVQTETSPYKYVSVERCHHFY